MLVEAAVLSGDEGPLHQQGHLAGDELLAGRRTELLNHLAIAGQQGQGAGAVVAADATHIRQQAVDAAGDDGLGEPHRQAGTGSDETG